MTTLKEKYKELSPNLSPTYWEMIIDVATQGVNENASKQLSTNVLPQGRYVERAIGSDRKARKTKADALVSVEALGGESIYLRPNGSAYHARIWGQNKDVEVLRKAREATKQSVLTGIGQPMFAMLYGVPGTGKTALVEASFGEGVRTLLGNGDVEVADLIGSYVQTPSGNFEWIDGDLVKAAENGEVYFIDEIGLIDPKVLSVIYNLMDGKREITITANPERGTVKSHPDFYVVAATNPKAPGVRLSEALLSRFVVQAEMTTDWNLARSLGVPTQMVTCAQNLYRKVLNKERISWSPQMRELLAFRDIATTFGTEFAIANMIASAPNDDRAVVADVLTRAYGVEAKPAKI